jgi:hypothetical protein
MANHVCVDILSDSQSAGYSPIFPIVVSGPRPHSCFGGYTSGHKAKVEVVQFNLIESNFLFDVSQQHGVLVDFGLAEVATSSSKLKSSIKIRPI